MADVEMADVAASDVSETITNGEEQSVVPKNKADVVVPKSEADVTDVEMLWLNDLQIDENFDVTLCNINGLGYDCVGQQPEPEAVRKLVLDEATSCQKISIPGLRDVPCPALHSASKGEEKSRSEKNNNWSMKRVEQLRASLGFDMSIPFGDLPFDQIDYLLSNLFSRVTKVNGQDYPSASLANMLGGFNRVLRHASNLRSLRGDQSNLLDKSFCIKKHPAFTKTRLTLRAAIKKTSRDGNNKKTKKVETLTESHEDCILADVDHQYTTNSGCQKRLGFYLMTQCGIRGGMELWELQRQDITIEIDSKGREYVKFVERRSKNNEPDISRTNEVQFRQPYYSYEPGFLLTAKQYLRHLPILEGDGKPDLFLQCIHNPIGNVWNNRVTKVSQDKLAQMLKNMLSLVNLPTDLITNKSGRATLITRMAAKGVPDDTGRLVTGHHTISGYSRYDRTMELKQEAVVLTTATPRLTYENAFKEVSANFMKEKIIGSWDPNCKPLMDAETEERMNELKRTREQQREEVDQQAGSNMVGRQMVACKKQIDHQMVASSNVSSGSVTGGLQDRASSSTMVPVGAAAGMMALWHHHYDQIDWEAELMKNPVLARALGGGSKSKVSNVAHHMAGIYSNCNITIHVVQPGTGDDKGKENIKHV